MAKTTTVSVTDDIDGSSNASEVSFTFQGSSYTIDLSRKNLSAFEKAIKPYVDAATKVSGRSRAATTARRGRRTIAAGGRAEVQAIREWAANKGLAVSSRGRIPQSVRDAYEAQK